MAIRINLLAESQAAEEMRRKDPVKRAVWIRDQRIRSAPPSSTFHSRDGVRGRFEVRLVFRVRVMVIRPHRRRSTTPVFRVS